MKIPGTIRLDSFHFSENIRFTFRKKMRVYYKTTVDLPIDRATQFGFPRNAGGLVHALHKDTLVAWTDAEPKKPPPERCVCVIKLASTETEWFARRTTGVRPSDPAPISQRRDETLLFPANILLFNYRKISERNNPAFETFISGNSTGCVC